MTENGRMLLAGYSPEYISGYEQALKEVGEWLEKDYNFNAGRNMSGFIQALKEGKMLP